MAKYLFNFLFAVCVFVRGVWMCQSASRLATAGDELPGQGSSESGSEARRSILRLGHRMSVRFTLFSREKQRPSQQLDNPLHFGWSRGHR